MIEDKLICIGQGEAEIQYKKNDGQIIDIGTLSEGEHFGLYNIFQLND